jgi:hypothetical protein
MKLSSQCLVYMLLLAFLNAPFYCICENPAQGTYTPIGLLHAWWHHDATDVIVAFEFPPTHIILSIWSMRWPNILSHEFSIFELILRKNDSKISFHLDIEDPSIARMHFISSDNEVKSDRPIVCCVKSMNYPASPPRKNTQKTAIEYTFITVFNRQYEYTLFLKFELN